MGMQYKNLDVVLPPMAFQADCTDESPSAAKATVCAIRVVGALVQFRRLQCCGKLGASNCLIYVDGDQLLCL